MRLTFLITFIFFSNSVFGADEIHFKFNKENSKYWQFISDQTMGGISNGQAVLEKDGNKYFARLIGNVSTANNGGFIQLRSSLSFINLIDKDKSVKGIRLNARGNGEQYHIFIRTSETRSYRDFFSSTFVVNNEWQIIDLPFKEFKHRFSNKSLDGSDIRTFGIVAYGRDFFSDISISDIIFYY